MYLKVTSCRNLKATVILYGAHFDEARKHAMTFAKENNLLYINGYLKIIVFELGCK